MLVPSLLFLVAVAYANEDEDLAPSSGAILMEIPDYAPEVIGNGAKRAVMPYSGGMYGKRAVMPFSGGLYGKRASTMPASGGWQEKRAVMPFSGGLYGKRAAMPFSGECGNTAHHHSHTSSSLASFTDRPAHSSRDLL
ncbi:hypothetical protein TELCIR_04491 [Teladorsagia circumcincta]|uniref:Uncharacterized protein n=1 Tax=Teladorsagia circumcincta TaxID=45464 RepID=A0A2G9UTG3_TELCI|nr:hypothetical protein TELCIR_04491 [Teladorsagia circumcincta]